MFTQYKLTGKYINGTQIIGYQVMDNFGEYKTLKTEDLEKLIDRGQVLGCKLIRYNGQTHIHCDGFKLAELPNINAMQNNENMPLITLTGRIFKGASLIGYIASDQNGKGYRLSKEKVWMAARNKTVTNALAQLNGSDKILRAVGMEFKDLPSIRV